VSVALLAPRAHLAVSAVVTFYSSVVAAIGVSAVVVAETGDAERHRLTEVLASLCIAGVLGGLVAAAVAIVMARPQQVAPCRSARARCSACRSLVP
jgi:phosphate/sulfate permease